MSHPHTHLRPGTPPPPAGAADWRAWSQAWTQHVPLLTGRTDLTVLVAPGAAGDAPECFYPDLNRIEVDATYIADSPDVTDPAKARHKRLVPTGYGLLVHGAAHAAHSRWTTPPGTPPILAAVADLLEESRAEGRQRARRRGDRRWLRHVVTTLLDPDDAAVDDAWHAGQLAALLLARVDARIVTSKDVRPVRAAVTGVLGRTRLRQLRDIWREAHTCDDTDADTMICLARRWCQVLGIDPDQQYDTPVPDAGLFAGRLAAALVDYLAVAAGVTPAEYAAALLAHRHSPPAEWDRTDPTEQEHRAARDLADRLRQARTRHPEPGRRPSAIPPGRLRTRQAITADAQIAAGQLPTAAPWQQRAQLPPEKPRLHLAVLVDLSGSMARYTRGDVLRRVDLRQRGPPRRTRRPPPSGSATAPPSWCPHAPTPGRCCTCAPASPPPPSRKRSRSPTNSSTCATAAPCGCSPSSPTATSTTSPPANNSSPPCTAPAAPCCGYTPPTRPPTANRPTRTRSGGTPSPTPPP